jgi:hypothetical protein
VCDINAAPSEAVELVRQAAPMLRDGAAVVVTLKGLVQ